MANDSSSNKYGAGPIAGSVGAPVPWRYKGEVYMLGVLDRTDLGTIEQHLNMNRLGLLNAIAGQVQSLPKEVGDRIIDRALERIEKFPKVTPHEVYEWIQTVQGMAFLIWLMIEKRQPGKIKLSELQDFFENATPIDLAQANAAIDLAAGFPVVDEESKKNNPQVPT